MEGKDFGTYRCIAGNLLNNQSIDFHVRGRS